MRVKFGLTRLRRLNVYRQTIGPARGLIDKRAKAARGVVVVERAQSPDAELNIITCAADAERELAPPHVGVVTHSGVRKVKVGSHVLFNPEHGKHLHTIDGDRAIIFGRAVGLTAKNRAQVVRVPFSFSILGEVDMTQDYPVTRIFGTTILVESLPVTTQTKNGILLPDRVQYGTSQGTVVMIGDDVRDVKVGDIIMYMASSRETLDINPIGFKDGTRRFMMDEASVLLVL